MRAARVVTLDADLQNPPEEIARLLAELDAGHDYVGTIRRQRQDSRLAPLGLALHEPLRERTRASASPTRAACCAPTRAHRRCDQPVLREQHLHPGAGLSFARNADRDRRGHEERSAGESKYSLYSLIRLNFDLMTGFSVVPLQLFSMLGMASRLLGGARRLPGGAPPDCRAPGRRACSRCSRSLLPARRGAVRHRPAGRIHRAHLRGGARRPRYIIGAVLESARPTVTRAVVFAYHDVGVRCLRVLLARASTVPLVVTHADDPGERSGSTASRAMALARPRGHHAGGSEYARVARAYARARPDFLFSFYYRHMLGRRCWRRAARRLQHARLAAAEIPRPRAGELGRAARRARNRRHLHAMTPSPMPAASSTQQAVPILPDDTAARSSARSPSRPR
jgi:hypothetical protein